MNPNKLSKALQHKLQILPITQAYNDLERSITSEGKVTSLLEDIQASQAKQTLASHLQACYNLTSQSHQGGL